MHQGLNIDIYPNYHVQKAFKRKIQLLACAVYMLFCEQRVPQNHGGLTAACSRILLALFRGKSRLRLRDVCQRYMAKYEGQSTKYMAQFYGNVDRCKRIYPADYFEGGVVQMRFVDEDFPVRPTIRI